MDSENDESKYSSSNFFNVVRIRESSFSQDAQYRPRKSPRKRLKVARISFMIDQLKSIFWRPSDFMSRIRTRRNLRPEFLMQRLRDNQRGDKECNVILHAKKNFAPEVPKIYSIGLHSGMGHLSDDFSNSALKCLKKRFNIIRRPMIICKYWIAQSTPLSTDLSLKTFTNRQTMIFDCTKSMDIISKYNRRRLHERIEDKNDVRSVLRNDCSFTSDEFKDSLVKKNNHDSFRTTRDAQIQTSNRKKRRKIKKRSKQVTENNSCRKYYNNGQRIVADTTRSRISNRKNYCEEPWLLVQVLENKRAEYINKFTMVNQQIEEITATLRETCCGESSRNNLENCDFLSISDNAKVNTTSRRGIEDKSAITKEKTKEKNGVINLKKIIKDSKSDQCKNEIPKQSIFSRDSEKIPKDIFLDHNSVEMAKETDHSSNKICRDRTKAKCRFKKMVFNQDEIKGRDNELQKFSIESKSLDKVYLRDNSTILNNNKYMKNIAKSFTNLETSKYCKKIIEEKMGEINILKDIKKRIDRDFDDFPERNGNDTDDFFTVSQKSSNFDHRRIIDVSGTMIEGSKSTPLIESTNRTETEIRKSMSVSAMSEHSNKNSSTLSKYFSCTEIPSSISLTKNEEEFDVNPALVNRDSSFDCLNSPDKFLIKSIKPSDTFEIFEDQESFAENKIRDWEYSSLGEENERTEKRFSIDSTFETLKSSKYVGSIDSGVFSSSLIDLYPAESSFDDGRTKYKKKRRAEKLDGSSAAVDFDSDSNYTDDTLDRKVNDAVRDLTKSLILYERKVNMKLRAKNTRYSRRIPSCTCKIRKNHDSCYDLFNSSQRSSEDERLASISTPSLLSFSDSEIEDCESIFR